MNRNARDEMKEAKSEIRSWWFYFVGLIVASMIIFGTLSSMGLIGKTIVERKVFENSFQYSEARKGEVAVFSAQLAEIDRALTSTSLTPRERTGLEGQAAAIRIQLAAARSKM